MRITVDKKWASFFKLLTRPRPNPDGVTAPQEPELPVETMGTVNFNVKGFFESVRVRLGHGTVNAPKAGRPRPSDARSRHFNTAYHTHFFDPDRVFNVPTAQDVVMFVTYNAVTRFCVSKFGPGWGTVRRLELVFTDSGFYTIANTALGRPQSGTGPGASQQQRLSDVILERLESMRGPSSVEALEATAVDIARAYCLSSDGPLFEATKRRFPEVSKMDFAADATEMRYMQEPEHHERYLQLFEDVVGVDVKFHPWESQELTFDLAIDSPTQLYLPLNL